MIATNIPTRDREAVNRFPRNFSPAEVRPNLYGVD
jgi:hypothetical protein